LSLVFGGFAFLPFSLGPAGVVTVEICFRSFVRSFITLPTANPRTVFSSESGSDSEDSEAAEALITEVI